MASKKSTLQIVTVKLADLTPYKNNARTHTEEQIQRIVESIKEFGWTNPVLIDPKMGVIAGHARLEAAKRIGMEEVPCIVLAGLTEAQKRAYLIADNKLAINAGWDEKLLAMEFSDLKNLGFNLDLLGFDASELADITLGKEVNQPEFDETVGDTVFMVECPKCGNKFPK
jgi:ParB family transcriptional regulator, chromosome partitioning protein